MLRGLKQGSVTMHKRDVVDHPTYLRVSFERSPSPLPPSYFKWKKKKKEKRRRWMKNKKYRVKKPGIIKVMEATTLQVPSNLGSFLLSGLVNPEAMRWVSPC